MPNTNLDFIQLLQEGKWEEALPGLREYLKSPATDAEKGRVQILLAQAYMQAATDINNRESIALAEAFKALQQVDEKEQKFDDDVGLAQARSALK